MQCVEHASEELVRYATETIQVDVIANNADYETPGVNTEPNRIFLVAFE
jgi:hypothetical protein